MPAAPGETDQVEHEVRVAAPPETVFGYFTDPSRLVEWIGAEATLDPRPGGVCRIVVTDEAVMRGEFVEVDPPRRLVISWGWEQRLFDVPPASTRVEVTLTPEDGGTRLRLVHRRLPEGALAFHRVGWGHFLPRLGIAATGADPGPDRWVQTAGRRLPPRGGTG